MSDSQVLPKGETPKCLQKSRTTFTRKQVETLRLLFDQNPYLSSDLRKKLASQMKINPIAIQIWFKNKRAKCRRVKHDIQKERGQQQSPQVQEQHQKSPQVQEQHQKSPQVQEQHQKSPQVQDQHWKSPQVQDHHRKLLQVPLQVLQPQDWQLYQLQHQHLPQVQYQHLPQLQHQKSPQLQCQQLPQVQHQKSPQLRHQLSPQVQHWQSPQLQNQQSLHAKVNTSPSQSEKNIPSGSLINSSPMAHIYTNQEIPSFQLSLCSDLKDSKYPPGGHKMVHFGCCQDPAIYWLQPILKSPNQLFATPFPRFASRTGWKKKPKLLMLTH